MNAARAAQTAIDAIIRAAVRDHTQWHYANVETALGGVVVVGVHQYSSTSPKTWRLDGSRASFKTICAVIDGADTNILPGNRAVIATGARA